MRWRIAIATVFASGAITSGGCTRDDDPDAYGNVEATEVVVGAETSGQLVWFAADEGSPLAVGALVAVVDTTQLALERAQITAQRRAVQSRTNEIDRQIDALEVQLEIARRGYERTGRLFEQEAATALQLDQTERDYRVLREQIALARAQRQTVAHDVTSSDARVALIAERIRRSQIRNPIAGTVLATYAEAGEFVQAGQPLYRIADLGVVEVRAYITEPQLSRVRIGQSARVFVDVGGEARRALPGTVTWVSPRAEFTPTPIQTREERADLVYAIKIRVPNEGGVLKIGMPADVQFVAATAAQ
jgi:HlyD family secretion protein